MLAHNDISVAVGGPQVEQIIPVSSKRIATFFGNVSSIAFNKRARYYCVSNIDALHEC